jgi:hypothetical protein
LSICPQRTSSVSTARSAPDQPADQSQDQPDDQPQPSQNVQRSATRKQLNLTEKAVDKLKRFRRIAVKSLGERGTVNVSGLYHTPPAEEGARIERAGSRRM